MEKTRFFQNRGFLLTLNKCKKNKRETVQNGETSYSNQPLIISLVF